MLDCWGSVVLMTNTTNLPSEAATQALIDEAMEWPASMTHPQYLGIHLGVDALALDVHILGTQAGDLAMCGEPLEGPALGMQASVPMCWLCADLVAR